MSHSLPVPWPRPITCPLVFFLRTRYQGSNGKIQMSVVSIIIVLPYYYSFLDSGLPVKRNGRCVLPKHLAWWSQRTPFCPDCAGPSFVLTMQDLKAKQCHLSFKRWGGICENDSRQHATSWNIIHCQRILRRKEFGSTLNCTMYLLWSKASFLPRMF